MLTFLKGIVVGLGAIAPGLSGSILLVMFGLYQRVVNIVSNIFKNFKKNILFLLPLGCGIVLGVLIFSKLVDFLITRFPMPTYYAFLGLILGTVPMLFKEAKKEGFSKKYYAVMAVSFVLGVAFFLLNQNAFPNIQTPTLFQSFGLGLAVAAAYLVPGVDSAAILSVFGLYELWVNALSNLNLKVLIPAGVGLVVGGLVISFVFNALFKKFYTATYSVIFGLFLSVILNFILKECPMPSLNLETAISLLLLIAGFVASTAFSKLEALKES